MKPLAKISNVVLQMEISSGLKTIVELLALYTWIMTANSQTLMYLRINSKTSYYLKKKLLIHNTESTVLYCVTRRKWLIFSSRPDHHPLPRHRRPVNSVVTYPSLSSSFGS